MTIKIIRNNKTGVEYPVTEDGWQAIVAKKFSGRYTIVREEKAEEKRNRFIPPEIDSTKKQRKNKKLNA